MHSGSCSCVPRVPGRALSDQLYGSPSSHQQLRHDASTRPACKHTSNSCAQCRSATSWRGTLNDTACSSMRTRCPEDLKGTWPGCGSKVMSKQFLHYPVTSGSFSFHSTGTYGTHIELSALAQLYRRPIKVVQPGLVYVIKLDETLDLRGGALPQSVQGCESRDRLSEGTEASVRPRCDDSEDGPGPLYIV